VLETELYAPVRTYLEDNGYTVQAEVKGIDVVAQKGDSLIAVELKTSINLSLIIQATKRQAITSSVYVAVPEPKRKGSHYRGATRVLKQLNLGLLLVRFGALGAVVQKVLDPAAFVARKSRGRTFDVIEEFNARRGDYNVGGTTREPLMTAYREHAIVVACCLSELGERSPRELKAIGTGDKTPAILADNHYGWFRRVRRGVYALTPIGHEIVKAYPDFMEHGLKLIGRSR
jgi:hypothetical protein